MFWRFVCINYMVKRKEKKLEKAKEKKGRENAEKINPILLKKLKLKREKSKIIQNWRE